MLRQDIFLNSVRFKDRFDIEGDQSLFTRILDDMQQNAGPLTPISHWEFGYSRSQAGDVICEENDKIYVRNMANNLDPWSGCVGMQQVNDVELSAYKCFLSKYQQRHLIPEFADANYLGERGWLITDLGTVMDLNLIYEFSSHLRTNNNPLFVLEVGGGYGRLAEAFMNIYEDNVKYVFLDSCPTSLMFAYKYLSRRLKSNKIGFFYNDDQFDMEIFDCYIMPSWHFERLNASRYHMAINVESFQEMGQHHVDYFLALFNRVTLADGLIYISNAHDYVFKGVWNYPKNWERLYLSNTPRSWSPDHPTEIFLKRETEKDVRRDINSAIENIYFQSLDNRC